MHSRLTDRPMVRALLWFAAWMLFGFLLVESLHVAIAWWQGRLTDIGVREGLWLSVLPLLIGIFVRYFSIFRPGCQACGLPPAGDKHRS